MKKDELEKLIIDYLAGELSKSHAEKVEKKIAEDPKANMIFEEHKKFWSILSSSLKNEKIPENLHASQYEEISKAIPKTKTAKPAKKTKKDKIDSHDEDITPVAWFRNISLGRVAVYGIIVFAFIILAGMLLPALNSSREKAGKLNVASRRKMEKLGGKKDAVFSDSDKSKNLAEDDYFGATGSCSKELKAKKQAVQTRQERKGKTLPESAPRRKLKKRSASPNAESVDRISSTRKKDVRSRQSFALDSDAVPTEEAEEMDDEGSVSKQKTLVSRLKLPESAGRKRELKTEEALNKQGNSVSDAKMTFSSFERKKEKQTAYRIMDFKVKLKLWDMSRKKSAEEVLKRNGFKNFKILSVNKDYNLIKIRVPDSEKTDLENFFRKLRRKERELNNLENGLPFLETAAKPVSTFSIDVDTASYTSARKKILNGRSPTPESIRAEEFINYFDYHYPNPKSNRIFSVSLTAANSIFRKENTELMIGVQGKKLGPDKNRRSCFTVLLDASASMVKEDRMFLAKESIIMLADNMKKNDVLNLLVCRNGRVSNSERILNVGKKKKLLKSILNNIAPGGVADIEKGIVTAYRSAAASYIPGGYNRVMLFTDGIVDIKNSSAEEILDKVKKYRSMGITNSIIGFGGDGNERLLEELSNKGDGNYLFIDSEREAYEIFRKDFASKFREIARNVKIQVEFNPDTVKSYRQVGYKNRQLSKSDFRDDRVDAGEVGSGQSVTALYELKLSDDSEKNEVIAYVRLRYQRADTLEIEENEYYILKRDIKKSSAPKNSAFILASCAAEFAENLRYPGITGISTKAGLKNKLRALIHNKYKYDKKVRELYRLLGMRF